MNKAFIFDLDGVIIDDEVMWEAEQKEFYPAILGKDVYQKLGSTMGLRLDEIHKRVLQCGGTISKQEFFDAFYKRANKIYQTAPVSLGLQNLVNKLLELDYSLGIVSSSPKEWINLVLQRVPFLEQNLTVVVSLFDLPHLRSKPSPDGYNEAIKMLDSNPDLTIALEDSNASIASAKASGAYTIGLKQNLVKGYKQVGADVYADTMEDVIKLVLSKR